MTPNLYNYTNYVSDEITDATSGFFFLSALKNIKLKRKA